MLVFIAYDDNLRVRIDKEHLESFSYGPGYGGTGALRLRQVLGPWFFAYRLDDDAPRGTTRLQPGDLERIQSVISSAHLVENLSGINISEEDLHELFEMVTDEPPAAISIEQFRHPDRV